MGVSLSVHQKPSELQWVILHLRGSTAWAPGVSTSPGTDLTGGISFTYLMSAWVAWATGWSHSPTGTPEMGLWENLAKRELGLFPLKPLLLSAAMQQTCPQGPWSGDVSPYVSQVQDGKTQLQPSTLVTHCLQLQLDQQWGPGCGLARRSLPCAPWSLAASADSGLQWLLFPGGEGVGNRTL